LPLAPVTSTVILGASVAIAVVDITQKLANLPLVEACQKAGEMSGDFAADYVAFNKAINATSTVAKIVITETVEIMNIAKQELAAMGKFTKAEIDAWIKSEKLVASSVEGLEITVNAKKADLAKGAESLHLEMNSFDKAKNPVKSSGDGAKIVSNAQKLTTKELSIMAEGLGYKKVKDFPFYAHNQPVFKKGNRFISPDVTCHKGGSWKIYDNKGNRLGTFDETLTKMIGE